MNKVVKIILVVLGIVVLLTIGYFSILKFSKEKLSGDNNTTTTQESTGKILEIPTEILSNKFGFLGAGPDSQSEITARGAAWIRPHPGPFLWDSMQTEISSNISFNNTDEEVNDAQDAKVGILATLWPFAEWDQKNRPNADDCKVSSNDEFLARKDKGKKGDMAYLPEHRCNPNDWVIYQKWVTSVVERYDGDGVGDMPDLKIPIKYWEVMNEPDLSWNNDFVDSRLSFYKQEPVDYAELLIKTSQAIRQADPDAKVVIAGAAGGNDQFLNFYRQVFGNEETLTAFDIANVHCISNDNYDSFNVEPYKRMLTEFGLESKPIWVTEAEARISNDPNVNATQVFHSTKKALELGVQKIFYTMYDFTTPVGGGGQKKMPQNSPTITPELDGSDAETAYQKIISQ